MTLIAITKNIVEVLSSELVLLVSVETDCAAGGCLCQSFMEASIRSSTGLERHRFKDQTASSHLLVEYQRVL